MALGRRHFSRLLRTVQHVLNLSHFIWSSNICLVAGLYWVIINPKTLETFDSFAVRHEVLVLIPVNNSHILPPLKIFQLLLSMKSANINLQVSSRYSSSSKQKVLICRWCMPFEMDIAMATKQGNDFTEIIQYHISCSFSSFSQFAFFSDVRTTSKLIILGKYSHYSSPYSEISFKCAAPWSFHTVLWGWYLHMVHVTASCQILIPASSNHCNNSAEEKSASQKLKS